MARTTSASLPTIGCELGAHRNYAIGARPRQCSPSLMAHIVGQPRPEVVFSRDVSGGPSCLFDIRTREIVEFSPQASAVLELTPQLCAQAIERARAEGVQVAVEKSELLVQVALQDDGSEARAMAERLVLETLAEIAVQGWFAEQGQHQ